MKFSYSAVWEETVRMLRGHASLLLAVAGVFFFLPALLFAHFFPQPVATGPRAFEIMTAYVADNWHWILLVNVANMVGAIAILLMLFDRQGRTVGNAIAAAFPILPAYFVASILSGMMVGLASIFLIVPGLYLFARFAVIGPVIVAEEQRHPLRAIKRSFEVTKSNGWAVLGLILLVAIAGFLVSFALSRVLGSVFLVAGGERVGRLLVTILNAFTGAVLSTLLVALFAAIYRQLVGRESVAAAVD